jgi:hypothetical protein
VDRNVYSVDSRLIGERVDVWLYADELEVWFTGKVVERLPRLRGQRTHRINYRHVIDWLVRKPGAFENYRYREDLFPTSRFRMAYDALRETAPSRPRPRGHPRGQTRSDPRDEEFASMDQGIYRHLTRRDLAALARERGDDEEARRLWHAVLAECPGDREALERIR